MENSAKPVLITGKDGLRGTLVQAARGVTANERQILVRLDSGQEVLVPAEMLVEQANGTYYIPLGLSDLTREDYQREGERIVIPIIAEELDVQKRKVTTGGVRLRKVVQEREEVVDEPLLREEVRVERVPVNRVVEGGAPAVRYEGEMMIVPVLEEVLVVEKRLMLKEELHITRHQATISQPQTVTLRSEEVTVEQLAPQQLQNGGKDFA